MLLRLKRCRHFALAVEDGGGERAGPAARDRDFLEQGALCNFTPAGAGGHAERVTRGRACVQAAFDKAAGDVTVEAPARNHGLFKDVDILLDHFLLQLLES